MPAKIEKSAFGMIQINGQKYKYDVVITLQNGIRKRKKKLSKSLYGTSHIISLDEAHDLFETGLQKLLIGSGVFDSVRLSDEAALFFKNKEVSVDIYATPKAADRWNASTEYQVALFHITC